MRKAREAGAHFVNISPASSDMAEFLSADWINLRPNTDTALLLAIAHTLIDEGLHDRAWLDRYAVGFEQFESYVLGRKGGVPRTAEWASAICDVSADTIRTLARRMASQRTFINVSWSVQRGDHGEQPYWAAITVAAMLGGIGLPGRGFSFGFGSINRQGKPTPNIIPPKLPTGKNAVAAYVPASRFVDMLLNPGAPLDFNGHKIIYPDIRLLYTCGGNPFHHQQDTNKVIRGLRCPETIITHEPWWTPAARYSDIVLPATTTLERNDLGSGSLDDYLFAMKQAIPPVGMARNDHDIFADIAQHLGLREPFTEGRGENEWLRFMYDEMRNSAATRGFNMPEFDVFWEDGYIHFPAADKPFVSFSAFRESPKKNPLKTPSGKIEIFSQNIQSFDYDDCPGHAAWLEPVEWLGSEKAKRYPIHLITNQPPHRLHSQLDMASISLAAKVQGREPILLHTADAEARGIKDGDVVRIFNDRGCCLAGAVLTDKIRKHVAFLSTGAWYDPLDPGKDGSIDTHGSANMVTIDKGCSKLSQAPSAQSALIEIELWHGPLPEITTFDPPGGKKKGIQSDRS
jgi:biotin/methionine sulfoxide reductase